MKNWIITGFVVLLAAIVASGYFNIRLNQDLNNTKSSLGTLQTGYQTLQTNLSDLQTTNTALKSTVATLQTTVTNLQNAPASTATSTISNTMVNLIPQIEPLAVRIDVSGQGFVASGSGIIVRQDGYIITNAHVIASAASIKATLMNGKQYDATAVSSDKTLDLAILKISGNFGSLPVATLGTTKDIVVGVSVVAAGFPEGLDLPGPASFSRGIVSANRSVNGQTYVQTDATINPGSSGGGLFTLDDKLIGITSSALLALGQDVDGLGLAIPVDVVQNYIQNNLK